MSYSIGYRVESLENQHKSIFSYIYPFAFSYELYS